MKAYEERKFLVEFVGKILRKKGIDVGKIDVPFGGKKGVVFIINDEIVLRLYRNPLKFLKVVRIQEKLNSTEIQVAPRLGGKGILLPFYKGYCAYSLEEFAVPLDSCKKEVLVEEAFWKLAVLHRSFQKIVSGRKANKFWGRVIADTLSRLDYCAERGYPEIRSFKKRLKTFLLQQIPVNWHVFSLCHTDIAWANMGMIKGSIVFFDWDRAAFIPPQFDFVQLAYVFNINIEKPVKVYLKYTGFTGFEFTIKPVEVVFLIKRMKRSLKRKDLEAFSFYYSRLVDIMSEQ